MKIIDEIEDRVLDLLLLQPEADQRDLSTSQDVITIFERDPDAVEDLKDHIWNILLYTMNYHDIIRRLRDHNGYRTDETESYDDDEEQD